MMKQDKVYEFEVPDDRVELIAFLNELVRKGELDAYVISALKSYLEKNKLKESKGEETR